MAARNSVYGLFGGLGLTLSACMGNTALPTDAPRPPSVSEPDRPDGTHGPGKFPGAGTPGPGTPFAAAPVSAKVPPPPISGGTLLSLKNGHTVVASDPDRDAIFVVDVNAKKSLATVKLNAGDEPGRAVEDGRGDVHVILRNGGQVLTLRAGTWQVSQRRKVCAAPRGISFDGNNLWVACAGGELLELPPTAAAPTRSFFLGRDLRDVVATGDSLLVTRFRSAEILTVSAKSGEILGRNQPPGSPAAREKAFFKTSTPGLMPDGPVNAAEPVVAWRMRPVASGGAVIVHQESSNAPLGTESGGYGGGRCGSAVGAAVTTVAQDGTLQTSSQLFLATLPVDVDISPNGKQMAMVFAGNDQRMNGGAPVLWMQREVLDNNHCIPALDGGFAGAGGSDGSGGMGGSGDMGGSGGGEPEPAPAPEPVSAGNRFEGKRPVAVAFDGLGRLVVQSRDPAVLTILGPNGGDIELSKERRQDSGFDVFHITTMAGLACASCHPEGGDDTRAWKFEALGVRRTQSLRGGIMHLAPFHWDGDMKDLGTLMKDVFAGRMQGHTLSKGYVDALGTYLDSLPTLPNGPVKDQAAVSRGQKLFNDSKVGCATCHGGSDLTNNATMDVGTGRGVQVPTLKGVAWRAPFMHTGCAPTLEARFDPTCGGGDRHGVTSHLTAAQHADLAAYMETL